MQSSNSLAPTGARTPFFASKKDYLAYRAAWRALLASGVDLTASHFAAHALLTGRDPYKAFSRNLRGHGQTPYGALARANADLASPWSRAGDAWLEAGLAKPGAYEKLREHLAVSGLSWASTQEAIARGEYHFPAKSEVAHG